MSGLRFTPPALDDAALILSWRTSPRVAAFMNTVVDHDLTAQRDWLARSATRSDYVHWLIRAGDAKIGLLNVSDLDRARGETSWGFYIGDDAHLGLGGLVPPYLYNHLFFELKLRRVLAEVQAANEPVLGLHRLHGYRVTGEDADRVWLELTAVAWAAKPRFHRFRAAFPGLS